MMAHTARKGQGMYPTTIPIIIVTDFSQDMRGEDGFNILDYDGEFSAFYISANNNHLSMIFRYNLLGVCFLTFIMMPTGFI